MFICTARGGRGVASRYFDMDRMERLLKTNTVCVLRSAATECVPSTTPYVCRDVPPPMLADRQRLECTMMQPVGHHNLHPRRCWCPEWTGNYTQYQLLLRSSFCLESLQPVSWCAPVWNMGPSVPLRGSSALYSVLQHRALAVTCCVSEEESLIFLCQLIAGQFQCS